MSLFSNEAYCTNPDLHFTVVRLQGNTTSALTLIEPAASAGLTLARTSEGIHTITFTDNPGNWVGLAGWSFEDPTPGNVDDHWCAVDNYASKVLTFTVTDMAAGTKELQDLATTSFLVMTLAFKRTNL